jgi:hypothetical protein
LHPEQPPAASRSDLFDVFRHASYSAPSSEIAPCDAWRLVEGRL